MRITKRQSAQWQQLADVPEAEFEAALSDIKRPSTAGLIKHTVNKPKQEPMDPDALWLWGRLRDFERQGLLDRAPAKVLGAMTDGMKADVQRLAPLVIEWLGELE